MPSGMVPYLEYMIKKHFFLSLKGEWEDNRKSLLEFIWAAHWGVKGVVSFVL